MNLQLKDFQEVAVDDLMGLVQMARGYISIKPQTVSLSSPTGSGKTITMCALIERICTGDITFAPDSQARFLWLSDSPELNEQSRTKFIAHSSEFNVSQLKTIENDFDAEYLERGTVYFLNTQKLGSNSNLIQRRDGRRWTIWETITNTIDRFPRSFYLILDEAHKGMTNPREVNAARTIVQKFIVGDTEVGMKPVPIIIGMSATPERFNALIGNTGRALQSIEIDPIFVADSGLLKERIIVAFASNDVPSDYTLLREAVKDWARYRQQWRSYFQDEEEKNSTIGAPSSSAERFLGQEVTRAVEPVLVVQVMDGRSADRAGGGDLSVITQTDLAEAMRAVIEECDSLGVPLTQRGVRHCFNTLGTISIAGYNIEYIEPSRIQDDEAVRIVFFKAALSTGWDCPRAEVMMSFRTTHDHTLIAQLIGRMVRTPLARKIQSNEFLNSVRLYLPHYDSHGVEKILSVLAKPDESQSPSSGLIISEKNKTAIYKRRQNVPDKFWQKLEELPSYIVPRRPQRKPNPERLLSLARLIHLSKLNKSGRDEWREAKNFLLDLLHKEWTALDADTRKQTRTFATVEIHEIESNVGQWQRTWIPSAEDDTTPAGKRLIDSGRTRSVLMSPENIDDIFEECGRKFGKGEDLHRLWWKRMADDINPDDPYAAKLALFFILRQPFVWERLRDESQKRIDDLFSNYNPIIKALDESHREKFRALRMTARRPEIFPLSMPHSIMGIKGEGAFKNHLFCNEQKIFDPKLNEDESAVAKVVDSDKRYIGWLRCEDRKPYSLCIPYERDHEHKAAYPDFLLVRDHLGEIVFDVVEPHGEHLDDRYYKAQGMRKFADLYGSNFGRIMQGRKFDNGPMRWLDFNSGETVLEAVKKY